MMSRSRRSSAISAISRTRPERLARGVAAALVLLVGLAALTDAASARPLAAIEARGVVSLCAHPNSLPFASRSGNPPGFQVEIGRALAKELGVKFDVAWIVSPIQRRAADCDIILDMIVDPEVQAESPVRVSKPYHHSGVALALPKDNDKVRVFGDLDQGKRIGVQVGSLAHMYLEQRGVKTTPFGFEDEMIEALADGTLDGVAVSPATIGYFNHTHPHRAVRLLHAYEHEPHLSWNVAVGMRGPDAALRAKIDAAVDRLLADGTFRAIYARYGIEHRQPAAR
jgi:polar amino acid transport system substrate-binding protein